MKLKMGLLVAPGVGISASTKHKRKPTMPHRALHTVSSDKPRLRSTGHSTSSGEIESFALAAASERSSLRCLSCGSLLYATLRR